MCAYLHRRFALAPGVVVGDHADAGVGQLGLAGQFGFWHPRHADHVAPPLPGRAGFRRGWRIADLPWRDKSRPRPPPRPPFARPRRRDGTGAHTPARPSKRAPHTPRRRSWRRGPRCGRYIDPRPRRRPEPRCSRRLPTADSDKTSVQPARFRMSILARALIWLGPIRWPGPWRGEENHRDTPLKPSACERPGRRAPRRSNFEPCLTVLQSGHVVEPRPADDRRGSSRSSPLPHGSCEFAPRERRSRSTPSSRGRFPPHVTAGWCASTCTWSPRRPCKVGVGRRRPLRGPRPCCPGSHGSPMSARRLGRDAAGEVSA